MATNQNLYEFKDVFFENRFRDKVMLITGSATGIGKETAIRAAKEGAKLALADKKTSDGLKTLELVQKITSDVIFFNLDIAVEENAKKMVEETVSKFAKLDIAINNGGIMGNPAPLHQLTAEQMDNTMKNNLYSVFFCAKYEICQFLAQGNGGVIVNNASIAGLTGLPGNPAYVASKHAVNGLTRNLALDYAKHNIRVNSVNPAGTDTPMVEEAMAYVQAKMQEAKKSGISAKDAMSMAGDKTQSIQHRQASAKEQAASILYLASSDAAHITGTLFATDGGWTAF